MANGFKIDRERLKPLPVGKSDWAEFSQTNYTVDKTLLIKDLIDDDTGVALFTRPRRFGKTTAMRMLKAFFEKTPMDASRMSRSRGGQVERVKVRGEGEQRWAFSVDEQPSAARQPKAASRRVNERDGERATVDAASRRVDERPTASLCSGNVTRRDAASTVARYKNNTPLSTSTSTSTFFKTRTPLSTSTSTSTFFKRPPLSTYFLHLFSLLVLATAHAAPVATSALTARAYVQDGLVALYDGIENAGLGLHDDATNRWTDLTGVVGDGTLASNLTWSENGWVNSSDCKPVTVPSAFSAYVAALTFTLEFRVKPSRTSSRETFVGNYNGSAGFNVEHNSGAVSDGRVRFYFNNAPDLQLADAVITNNEAATIGLANSAAQRNVYKEGTLKVTDTTTITATSANLNSGISMIAGGENSRTTMAFRGTYHALRLYSRSLSTSELAWNAMIDRHRYEGAALDGSLSTSTRRLVDGELQGVTSVSVSSAGGGQASMTLNGVHHAADESIWLPLNPTNAITYRAVPSSGRIFAGWTGDTAGLTSAQRSSTNLTLTAVGPRTLTAVFYMPVKKYWVGSSSTSASAVANWADDESGTAATALPQSGDEIVVSDLAENRAMFWNLNIEPGGWLQTNYTGTVTFQNGLVTSGYTVYGTDVTETYDGAEWSVRETRINGDVALWSGTWTHTAQPSLATSHAQNANGLGVYRLQVKATGDFIVGPAAKLSGLSCGFPAWRGPGIGTYHQRGVAHGGTGTGSGAPYGSAIGPVTQGSSGHGSNNVGGGVVRLKVGGKLTLDGPINVNGNEYYNAYASSGGSVWITTGEIAGTNRITSAGGGGSGGYPPAGGGRISIVLTKTGADFSNYDTSLISARGGWHGGVNGWHRNAVCGTIYLETAAQGDRHGELIVRGYGTQPEQGYYTGLCSSDGDCHFSKVSLSNGVRLGVMSGATLVYSNAPMSSASTAMVMLYGGGLRLPTSAVISNTTVIAYSDGSTIQFLADAADKTLTVTNASLYLDRPLTINGSLVIAKGASLQHESNASLGRSDTNAMARIDLTLAGDLTVCTGACVWAKGCGFAANTGTGKPDGGNYGAAHGGLPSTGSAYATTYGSFRNPDTYGSGGRQPGGGVIKLNVAGKTTLWGRLDADGNNYSGGGNASGAGGSIWLTTGSLRGTANIRACGGLANLPAAGGGRIAVTLTDPDADFSLFTGRIVAWGAGNANSTESDWTVTPVGGNGTVYLRKGGEGELDGTLVLDNNNSTSKGVAYLSSECFDTLVGNVVITNKGGLHIGLGQTLNVRRDWTFVNGGTLTNAVVDGETPGGTVIFTNAAMVSRIRGNTPFYNLSCLTPNKELQFEAATLVTNRIIAGGTLTLLGAADADGQRVKVRSTVDGTRASLAVADGATTAVKYADVQDSDASGGVTIVAEDSIGEDANNENWNFTSIHPGDVIEWVGKGSTGSWANPANWDRNRAPVETDVVRIGYSKEATGAWPELAGAVTVNQLQIAAGSFLTLAGSSLTVTNGFENLGEIHASGTETLTFSRNAMIGTIKEGAPSLMLDGRAAQSVDLGGQAYNTITISKTGGSVAFTNSATCAKFLYTGTDDLTLTFAKGLSLSVDEMRVNGASGNAATLTMAGAVAGETWNLSVKNLAIIGGVKVRDSVAASALYADAPSESLGNNVNWNFGSRTVTWAGGSSGAYDVAENWSDGEVPDATTRLLLDTTATITIGADKTLAVRELLAESGTATLTGKGALTVATTFLMESGSKIVLDVPTTIGQYAEVQSGATLTHTGPHNLNVTNRVSITVGGDMVMAGTVDVNGKGWRAGVGLGYKNTHMTSASHGGRGTEGTPCYGSITAPDAPGSGGYGGFGDVAWGGGVVRLNVAGTLTLSGKIAADATRQSWGVGSGGSVWITAGTLVGAGRITAWGGDYTDGAYKHPGAGGRISLCQTVASDFSNWTGLASAAGGRPYSSVGDTLPACSAGTVYRMAKGWERGEVIVDNDGSTNPHNYDVYVDLPVVAHTTQSLEDYRNFRVIVRNGGYVGVTRDFYAKKAGLGDLDLATSNAKLLLRGHVLTIFDRDHRKRKGWKGSVTAAGGEVRWRSLGMAIMVK